MRVLFRLTVLGLAAAVPAGLSAQEPPVVMMCKITDDSGTGWVPDFLMLTRQTSGPHQGRIEVFDPILKNLLGHPIQAQITGDDRDSRSYGWALAGVTNRSGQKTRRLDFRLTVSKRDGSAGLTVRAQGYDNSMAGSGVCGSPGAD